MHRNQAGFIRDKTMDDNFTSIPNYDKQNHPFCIFKKVLVYKKAHCPVPPCINVLFPDIQVTCAWIGPHKSQKNKESSAMPGNAAFMKWLNDHDLTIELFHQVNIQIFWRV